MREKLFRAWHKNTEKWVYFTLAELVEEIDFVYDDFECWCDYIGKKDKKRTPIFEGDIIKYEDKIRVVEYHNDLYSFQMGLSNVVVDQEIGCTESEFVEIIGNIMENPELYKEKLDY